MWLGARHSDGRGQGRRRWRLQRGRHTLQLPVLTGGDGRSPDEMSPQPLYHRGAAGSDQEAATGLWLAWKLRLSEAAF